MDLIISGGKIVTSQKSFVADVGIEKGLIKAVAETLPKNAKEIIDASNMLVFPGAIDAHVHFQLPVGGMISADNFENGTKAAACGGVTTVIDFATQKKGRSLLDAVRKRKAEANGKAAIDYALHASPTNWNKKTPYELSKLLENGITSFKLYMTYSREGLMSDDAALFSALEFTAKEGGLIMVHAESDNLLNFFVQRYHTSKLMKRFGAFCQALSRPNFIEAEAISRVITWAEATGGRLYIVHVSTAEGVEIVHRARQRRQNIYAETCPQYLLLDDSVFKRPNGHLYASCPQVKKMSDSQRLWQRLADKTIATIATDHCTFTSKQKAKWRGDFTRIPYGLPGVETMLPLIYTYGVAQQRITENRMVELLSTNPAKLFGLYPQKGEIMVGSDADLVIYDIGKNVSITHSALQTKCDWSPYEGFKLRGYPYITISRGKIVAKEGKFIGKSGQGRFLKRKIGIDL